MASKARRLCRSTIATASSWTAVVTIWFCMAAVSRISAAMACEAWAVVRSPDFSRRRIAERTSNAASDDIAFASALSVRKKRMSWSLPFSWTKSFARALESKKNCFSARPDPG